MSRLLWIPRALVSLLMLGVASAQLPAPAPRVAANYGKLPLAFEPNVGQTDGQVRFVSRGGGMTAFFTDTETVMVLSRSARESVKTEQAVVRMKLKGTGKPQGTIGLDKLPGVSNYFLGNDPTKWRTDVPHYARIEYEGVYPGVDLVWYGNQRQLEYDFVVAAGADPKQIQVAYEGVESVGVEAGGELVLRTALGEVRQQAPRVYQDIGGKRVEVEAHYAIAAQNRVSFELASYDRKRELRIDPVVLVYSTYLGGGGSAIAVDGTGAAYITGIIGSANLPTKSAYQNAYGGGQDVFVTKLAPTGDALIYSTYLGGSGYDVGNSIAVDGAGSAYVTGITMSADFPVQSPYQGSLQGGSDAFVTKLAPAGNALVYSTYLGGTGSDSGYGIAVDGAGSAYIAGETGSADFPTQSAYQASIKSLSTVFVTKLVPAGDALAYSTFLGGTGGDAARAISVDGAGSAYVTGMTTSADFPTQSPFQGSYKGGLDAFVTKFAPDGKALVYSTFLGGSGYQLGQGIAIDGTGAAYVTGNTNSPDFPATSPVQRFFAGGTMDAFVTKFTPAGNALVYSTYLGGSGFDQGFAIAVDRTGSAYVAGTTDSPNFPVQSAYQSTLQGTSAGFVTALSAAGSLAYSTYLGGSGEQGASGIAVDAEGSAYVAGSLAAKLTGYSGVFALLSPAQNASAISITPTLSWDGSPFATSYDLYFGTSSSPPIMTTTSSTSYALGPLSPATTYYWRVVARNAVAAGSTSSATWSFTTQDLRPPAPLLVSPANGATGVSVAAALIWNESEEATSYDIYFGTAATPPLVKNTNGLTYVPATLTAATTYYWRVVAENASGSNTSATWSFTTQVSPPPAPLLTAPANGATGVLVAPTLTWTVSSGATFYDVYFGTAPSPALVTNTTGTTYTPATLTANTTYYWRIAAKNAGGSNASATWSFTTQILAPPAPVLTSPVNGAGGVLVAPTLVWDASAGATSYEVYFGTAASPSLVTSTTGTSYAPGPLSQNTTYYWRIVAGNSAGSGDSATWAFTTGTPPVGLEFVAVTPCRVADTRNPVGPFGGPSMAANTSRPFAIPQSPCGIPNTAQAYSLNVTVVPKGALSFLTLWPTGQDHPLVSTLNSFEGAVVANAAIVPAGAGGAVSVFVTNATDVILDINGYFDTSSGPNSYSFYPATPCRVADTRGQTGQFGGPSMHAGESRDFPMPLGACAIPAAARGYSLNITVVPPGPLSYLTLWPTGQARPLVSTLNSWAGKVVANAAIVPAGTNESISVFVTNPTDVILDGNGYFAPPGGPGALSFYPVTPCRIADTRDTEGLFGGPEMDAQTTRSFAIPASQCNVPSTAQAYSVNVTVVPDGRLSYLSAWPTGAARPLVSTLNSWDGSVVANAAIVPAGNDGAISIFVTDETQVILDINGYFAP